MIDVFLLKQIYSVVFETPVSKMLRNCALIFTSELKLLKNAKEFIVSKHSFIKTALQAKPVLTLQCRRPMAAASVFTAAS